MKKSVCLLSFLLLSLNCYAGEIFPISTPNAIQIDGTINCKGDKVLIFIADFLHEKSSYSPSLNIFWVRKYTEENTNPLLTVANP